MKQASEMGIMPAQLVIAFFASEGDLGPGAILGFFCLKPPTIFYCGRDFLFPV